MSDDAFRQFVRGFAHIGYGRMMQIISEEWYKSAKRRGEPLSGVNIGYPIGLLPQEQQQEKLHELESVTGKRP